MSKKETKNKGEAFVEDQIQQEDNNDVQAEPTEQVKSELELLKDSLAEEKDKFMRLFAEFDNYRKRTSRESIEIRKTASSEVLSALLPVLDDFNRALVELKKSENDSLYEGVELIHSKLNNILTTRGLKEIEVQPGDTFNAEFHEAITQVPAPNKKLVGKIVDVVEKGYTLGDKVLRYPKVVTGQ